MAKPNNMDCRILYPISYYRFKKGMRFNVFLFLIDLMIVPTSLALIGSGFNILIHN